MEQVRFLIDRIEAPPTQGMLHTAAGKALDVTIELTAEKLNSQLGGTINQIATAVATADLAAGPLEIAEVTFSLNIGFNGEVSVMSLISGNLATDSGIQVTLRRKNSAND